LDACVEMSFSLNSLILSSETPSFFNASERVSGYSCRLAKVIHSSSSRCISDPDFLASSPASMISLSEEASGLVEPRMKA